MVFFGGESGTWLDILGTVKIEAGASIYSQYVQRNVLGGEADILLTSDGEILLQVDLVVLEKFKSRLRLFGDLDGIEPEVFLVRHRHEDGNLRAGRVQQAFFERVELRRDVQYIGLDLLDLSVEALHLPRRKLIRQREVHREGDQNECP